MRNAICVGILAICLFLLAPCGAGEHNGNSYFIAKVIEVEAQTMVVEITDKGNCGVSVGGQARVSAEKIADVLADDPQTISEHYVRIEFDGNVMETYPLQLGEIFQITITDETGASVE